MFCKCHIDGGEEQQQRTGVVDARCNETERKAVGKMLQDVPVMVFCGF